MKTYHEDARAWAIHHAKTAHELLDEYDRDSILAAAATAHATTALALVAVLPRLAYRPQVKTAGAAQRPRSTLL